MVLIISNENDYSTGIIIKYLMVNGFPCIRLTEKKFITGIKVNLSAKCQMTFEVEGQTIDYDDISSFWFRKNKLELLKNMPVSFPDDFTSEHRKHLAKFIFDEELKSLRDFIVFMLEKKHFLGNISVENGNKLISFIRAQESGLQIPNSLITSSKSDIEHFSEGKSLMAKPIEEGYYFLGDDYFFYSTNSLFEAHTLDSVETTVFPSCIQEYIPKKIELRVFYLNGICYSMAIFSQSDAKTKIDFRNYNEDVPNRMTPYRLPEQVTKSIDTFMQKMNLRTGSIDLILTENNEYVFLEVNPVGQYGMVAANCNYPLDELIFKDLVQL